MMYVNERWELKDPYKSCRHIMMFKKEEKANDLARILNYALYFPIGLTKDEITILTREDRAKYFVRKSGDNYEVLEGLVVN